ncbi:hypothetical protein I0Q91_11940 [Halanaerobiaceae bacterium Z-7014]|uniref:Uncharacterized protein n=1 Tax=Halonatronomonas betaini TaxID=2778430 RepID=A0A931AZU0_9FIRM|nr:hypothetical protein [Halonatronomonas betaini]MBF8437798.1 hypothetical protein [Halonatronomonas betaini]
MRQTRLIFVMIFGLIMINIFMPGVVEADSLSNPDTWLQRFNGNDVRQVFALDSTGLELPDDNFKQFSDEGQEKLFALASQFGEEQYEEDELFSMVQNSEGIRDLREVLQLNNTDNNRIDLPFGREAYISADQRSGETERGEESLTSFNLSYDMNPNMTIRAGIGQRSSSSWEDSELEIDEDDLIDESVENSSDTVTAANIDNFDDSQNVESDVEAVQAAEEIQSQFIEQLSEMAQLGISYQPASNVFVSADYISDNIFNPSGGSSTVFGLEYQDNLGNIRASYQIDNYEEMRQTITGLELDLLDLATLSTSYKLFDINNLQDTLESQGGWELDIGLDLNVTDSSRLSIGYQMLDSLNSAGEMPEFDQVESNVQASFEIRF